MSQDRNIYEAGMGYMIGNYLLKGISFLTIPLFSRLMTISDYGIYNTFIAYESILYIFIGFALHSSYKNAKYKFKTNIDNISKGLDYDTYVSATIIFILLNSVLFLFLIVVMHNIVTDFLELDTTSLFLLILYSTGTALITCYNAYIGLEYHYKTFIIVSAFNALTNIFFSVFLMLFVFPHARYLSRIIGTSIPVIVISAYVVIIFCKNRKPKNLCFFWKWGIKYSLPIIPHGISQVILSQFDRIMINKMVNVASAGIYSFAYNIYAIIAVTTISLDNVWNPWFYEQMHQKNYNNIKKRSSIYIVIMMLFTSAIIMISPEIVLVLGAKDYWEATYSVIPIVTGGYFAFLYTIPASVEYYYEKTKFIAFGSVSAAIINIILNAIFISYIGYIAAAYTTLFTYILYFIFHYILAKKIYGSYLFSNKIILGSSCIVIFISFISNIFIKYIIIRWCITIVLGIFLIAIEEKYLKLLQKMILKYFN